VEKTNEKYVSAHETDKVECGKDERHS